jgi:ribonuclease D
VAQALASWRERRAAEVDRPVRFLLPDLALVAMAQRPPASEDDLRRVRGLDDGKKRGGAARELLAVVAEGLELPLDEVEVPPTEGVDRSRRAAASLVSAWAAQRARDLEIDPAILATRADIEALLMGDGGRLASGWRHDVVGEPIRALAAGEASLALDGQGRLRLEARSGVPITE